MFVCLCIYVCIYISVANLSIFYLLSFLHCFDLHSFSLMPHLYIFCSLTNDFKLRKYNFLIYNTVFTGKVSYLQSIIYGSLEQKEDEIVLMAHQLLPVQDIQGSLKTLSLLSTAVCPMYYQ